jgi:putative zinc finger/helix-turn-helix YgiT family protein
MMSDTIPPVGRDRPFPWRCIECRAKEVYRQATDFTSTREYDGQTYTIRIPDLMLPTCRNCGAQTFAVGDDEPIFAALRAQIGLLSPQEIQEHRNHLKFSQQELAEHLGVDKEMISRWETGGLIESRAMDKLLRLFFESEEVRQRLWQWRTPTPSPSAPLNRAEATAAIPQEHR